MSWEDGKWLGPLRVCDAIEHKWWEQIPPNAMGVYRLIALAPNGLTPARLNRICGVDESGTLSIGGSKSLMVRLSELVKTHLPDYLTASHRPLSSQIARDFSPDRLSFTWEFSESPWEREKTLRQLYLGPFGELLPLDRMS